MRTLSKEELEKIIENHKHWLNKDCEGCVNMRAEDSMIEQFAQELKETLCTEWEWCCREFISEKIDEIAEKYKAQEQTLEQIKWERDCAISQLEELGTSLGENPEIARQRIQEQKWISVEEMLPKEDGLYVVIVKNTDIYMKDGIETRNEYTKVDVAEYCKGEFYFYLQYPSIKQGIIAWMPVPEYHIDKADKKVGGAE